MISRQLDSFCAVYDRLNDSNLELLDDIYSDDIHFSDPAHDIRGLHALKDYFGQLYRNADEVTFHFGRRVLNGSEAFVQWRMAVRHPRLNRGRTVEVEGCSYLCFNDRGTVFRHQDYFDLGALLYEQLPLLGGFISSIKRRLGR